MPLYTYVCDLKHETDKLRPMGNMENITCPECGQVARRVEVYRVRSILQDAGIIPNSEPEYQDEASRKSLKKRGWDGDRAIEHIRNHMIERRDDGVKELDVAAALADT